MSGNNPTPGSSTRSDRYETHRSDGSDENLTTARAPREPDSPAAPPPAMNLPSDKEVGALGQKSDNLLSSSDDKHVLYPVPTPHAQMTTMVASASGSTNLTGALQEPQVLNAHAKPEVASTESPGIGQAASTPTSAPWPAETRRHDQTASLQLPLHQAPSDFLLGMSGSASGTFGTRDVFPYTPYALGGPNAAPPSHASSNTPYTPIVAPHPQPKLLIASPGEFLVSVQKTVSFREAEYGDIQSPVDLVYDRILSFKEALIKNTRDTLEWERQLTSYTRSIELAKGLANLTTGADAYEARFGRRPEDEIDGLAVLKDKCEQKCEDQAAELKRRQDDYIGDMVAYIAMLVERTHLKPAEPVDQRELEITREEQETWRREKIQIKEIQALADKKTATEIASLKEQYNKGIEKRTAKHQERQAEVAQVGDLQSKIDDLESENAEMRRTKAADKKEIQDLKDDIRVRKDEVFSAKNSSKRYQDMQEQTKKDKSSIQNDYNDLLVNHEKLQKAYDSLKANAQNKTMLQPGTLHSVGNDVESRKVYWTEEEDKAEKLKRAKIAEIEEVDWEIEEVRRLTREWDDEHEADTDEKTAELALANDARNPLTSPVAGPSSRPARAPVMGHQSQPWQQHASVPPAAQPFRVAPPGPNPSKQKDTNDGELSQDWPTLAEASRR